MKWRENKQIFKKTEQSPKFSKRTMWSRSRKESRENEPCIRTNEWRPGYEKDIKNEKNISKWEELLKFRVQYPRKGSKKMISFCRQKEYYYFMQYNGCPFVWWKANPFSVWMKNLANGCAILRKQSVEESS